MSGATGSGTQQQSEQSEQNTRETAEGQGEVIITRRKIFLLCAVFPASLEAFSAECFSSKSSVTLVASLRTSSGRSASFASCKPREGLLLAYTQVRVGIWLEP